MTKEEAKRRLLEMERCTPIHTREDARDFEALEMAIQALSQEPCDECKYKTFTELYFHTDPEMAKQEPCETCGYAEGSPFCLQYCPYDADRKAESEDKE